MMTLVVSKRRVRMYGKVSVRVNKTLLFSESELHRHHVYHSYSYQNKDLLHKPIEHE
jgi:hypothetical protein